MLPGSNRCSAGLAARPPPPVLQDVNVDYHLGKVLGRGQFGTTRVAEHKAKQRTFACKSIAKRKLTCVLCGQPSRCRAVLPAAIAATWAAGAPCTPAAADAAVAQHSRCRRPHPCLFPTALPPCSCPEDIEDVQREVQIMHHLKGHENITYLQVRARCRTVWGAGAAR